MEAAYHVLAEQSSELICRHTRDSTLRYASPACRRLLGQSSEELLGTAALTLVDTRDRDHVRAVLLALLSGYSEQARFRARFRRPDGTLIWLDVTAYPLRGGEGQPIEEYVTLARELLGELEPREEQPGAMPASEATQVRRERAPFEVDRMLDAVASALAERAAERRLELVFDVDPRVPDTLNGDRTRLGRVITELADHALQHTEHGEVVLAVELLHKDERHARLRVGVRSAALESEPPGSESPAQLASTQQLLLLMGSRLSSARAAEGGGELRFELTLELASGVERAKLPATMHKLRVMVVDDSQAVRASLTRNLLALGAAVCALPCSGAVVEALTQAEQRGEPYPLVLVGASLRETAGLELVARLREASTLAHRPTLVVASAHSRHELGTGRDLTHVRGFLHKPVGRSALLDLLQELVHAGLHRSRVEPPGAGASKAQGPSRAQPSAASGAAERKTPLAGLTILVVEDNEINQILARDLLEAAGAEIVLASDGSEALRLASERTPGFDVIMMDVQMPGMDGHVTTRALRLQPKTEHTPIIAMTAHAFDAERAKCLASGMNAHVSKPISPRELVQTIERWARGTPAASADKPIEPPPARHAWSLQPSFDETALASVFRDPARQVAFLRKFVDAAQRAVRELEPAWAARDLGPIGFAGHKLKSSAKACGANHLAALFADLEHFAKLESWSELERCRREAGPLLEQLERHVAGREALLRT